LGYASAAGWTFLDRELYLPKAWTQDRPRCEQAAVPEDVEFVTKPELAIGMLTRALDAGMPASWVTGDEVYGQHPGLRAFLQAREMSYVLCVASNQWVRVDAQPGSAGAGGLGQRRQLQVKTLAATVPPQAFKKLSAGQGAKGLRVYSWARTPVHLPGQPGEPPKPGWLLIRRSLADPSDCAYYLCSAPVGTTLATWSRWPERDGPSRTPSRQAREKSAWTTTKSAATTAGEDVPGLVELEVAVPRSAPASR